MDEIIDEKRMWVQTLWEPLNEKSNSPMESKEAGIRVVAYCRVSNNKNNFSSLLNQVNYYTDFIRSKPNWKFVGIYFDNGISGATYYQRPGFKRMLRHCKEGKIDLILTKSVSRFSRNSKELIDMVNKLKEKNIGIYFEKENIDTSINYNKFLLESYAAIAQDEIETISQLVEVGYERRIAKGILSFGKMYGYEVVEHEGHKIFKINVAEAEVVRWMFNQLIGGKTYAQINRELISKGIKTKKDNERWDSGLVRKILMNIAYTGNKIARMRTNDMMTGKIKTTSCERNQYFIENSHPAIISDEVYALAQKRIKDNGHKWVIKRKEFTHKPFSKRIICGRCKEKFRSQHYNMWCCLNAFPSVGRCDINKLKDKQLLQMSIKAFKERFDFSRPDTLKELLKILQRTNQNDNFEFHRLKYFTEIEIALVSTIDEKKVNELREEYEKFEKQVTQIEDDRIYRDQAIAWLEGVDSMKGVEDSITIEFARAWIVSIEVYSDEAYIVKWIDEKETVIGEDEIEKIKEVVKEKQQEAIDASGVDSLLNENALELLPISCEEGGVVMETMNQNIETQCNNSITVNLLKDNNFYNTSNPEVIKLEPGLGIEAITNIKKNLAKLKAMNLLSENKKKLRVAAYARVSTHMDQQKISLQSQIAYYVFSILKNTQWEFAGIFADQGESGTSVKRRDDFNRMINEAKAGKIDLIITKSISRFSRNVVDVLETIKTLRELPSPVHCYFEKENIHTSDDKSLLLITLMSSIAQNEVTMLSSNITWGIQKLAQRGIIHKTTDFYGYTIDKNRVWKVVPEEAEVIRWIAKEYIGAKSYNDIIKALHDMGIKSPTGNEYWSDNTIRGILKNEKFKGDYLFQKYYTPDVIRNKKRFNNGEMPQYYIEKHHPAILDKREWDLIQEELSRRSRIKIKNPKALGTAGRSSFYNKFFCAECGGVISRYRSRSRGNEGSNWRCFNSYKSMNVECNVNISLRQEYLELNLMETLREIHKRKTFREAVQRVINNIKLTQEESLYEQELRKNIKALNQELYAAVDEEMAKEGYDTKKIDFLTGEIIKLQNELKEFVEREEKADQYGKELNKLLKVCAELEPINFRDYHNMDVRIKPGDSIYSTTKNAKDSTYIKKNEPDNFLEDIFNKYITKGKIDHEGRITYTFIFGVEYGIILAYKEYLDKFEKAKAEINLEELLISKEAKKLAEFCKEARYPKEMRDFLNISSHISFDKRILKPLVEAGKLKLIGKNKGSDWKYYWTEEK